ncbi:MAG: hypothetical protein PHP45_11145, partial [Elusimicrobiales bacterium]|nr:hypothetical protein [Elusimicrobiales bacterium]
WSMPEGLGFWDYQNDEQMKKDSAIYPVNRKDRELMQKGTIRLAYRDKGRWTSVLVGNQDFMYAGRAPLAPAGNIVQEKAQSKRASVSTGLPLPDRIRVPGTNKFINRTK